MQVLAEYAGKPVLVQKGNVMAAAFHPELTQDSTVHRHFLQMVEHASETAQAEKKAVPTRSSRRGKGYAGSSRLIATIPINPRIARLGRSSGANGGAPLTMF